MNITYKLEVQCSKLCFFFNVTISSMWKISLAITSTSKDGEISKGTEA